MEKWENSGMIAQGIWIILIFVFILAFSIVLLVRENFQRIARVKLEEEKVKLEHQQKLLETNILVQERERTRIAADIHDILIGKLTVLKIKNEIAYDQKETDELIKDSIAVARRISHDLSLPMLQYTDLDQLISELIKPWKIVFNINLKRDNRSTALFSDNVKIQLTRILQELIMNIVKHAEATTIDIHLRHTDKWLFLFIKDNGKGFDIQENSKGLGLKNIEFRMEYIKGKYKQKSKKGRGTSYLFTLNQSEFGEI
ncbi:ATP-binding protein [uncultured Flavobacterium sp.]|uniref:sensor histidine kinase n=1 Tax=uncultured Flavobacterium sp. TaxID=165435 RepID=UPI0025CB808A|nr:ATP-binding protein [uncultured Flavobacterium sp.]